MMFLNRVLYALLFLTLTWQLLGFPCQILAVPATMFTAANSQKPGCEKSCGNITVPYPFGIGRHCAMSDDFVVNCNDKNGEVRLRYDDGLTIFEMSEAHQLTLTAPPFGSSCNDTDSQLVAFSAAGTPYAVSSNENVFMVVGCQHYGLLKSRTKSGLKRSSCIAVCDEEQDLSDKNCDGLGCCQADVPKGSQDLDYIFSYLDSSTLDSSVSAGNCSYSFLAKRSSINFRQAKDLLDPDFEKKNEDLQLVYDWFIPNATCREARTNSNTYACQQNTTCIDLDQKLDVYGYRCKCHDGFEGNPYLIPGCSDIDECQTSNPCTHGCMNTPGDYECSCPSGFDGDGKTNGTGCHLKGPKMNLYIGLGIGLGSVLFVFGGYWIFVMAKRRKQIARRASNFKRNGGLLLKQQMSSEEGLIEKTSIFSADELDKATDHFNEDRVLGQGGQGTVYKGMLSDGNIVAIKKSKKVGITSHVEEFINELLILSQINHRNIVNLLGCCLETETPLLVYEFVPNGTLSKCIHDPSEDFPITWEMRLQIAVDIAGALNYLHSASSTPIFHRDIKAANILLDAKYRAKLSDFGTSRSYHVDQTHVTTRVMGTFGYLDPEYFRSHHFTDKSDVYGFGVVLVELLTGLRAILPSEVYDGKSLVGWFLSAMENSDLYDILATRVAKEGKEEAILAFANLAKRCLNMDGKHRPTMMEAVVELEMIRQAHFLSVSDQKTMSEVNSQTASPNDRPVPPNTSGTKEEDMSTVCPNQDHSVESVPKLLEGVNMDPKFA